MTTDDRRAVLLRHHMASLTEGQIERLAEVEEDFAFSIWRALAAAFAIVASLALMVACPPVKAMELEAVGVHVGSKHWPARDYRNFNPGIYARATNGLTVGLYRNSESRNSAYIGMTLQTPRAYLGMRPAVTIGAVSGYRRPYLLAPSVLFGDHVRIVVLPKIEKDGAAIVSLMLEMPL
jgi:hypothetical protein